MDPIVILIAAGVVACWVALSIFGSERQRQLNDFEARRGAAAAFAAAIAAGEPARRTEAAQAAPNKQIDALRRKV